MSSITMRRPVWLIASALTLLLAAGCDRREPAVPPPTPQTAPQNMPETTTPTTPLPPASAASR